MFKPLSQCCGTGPFLTGSEYFFHWLRLQLQQKKALNHLKKFLLHSFFLTRKMSFIYNYLFLKYPFINVGNTGTGENIIENLVCFIYSKVELGPDL